MAVMGCVYDIHGGVDDITRSWPRAQTEMYKQGANPQVAFRERNKQCSKHAISNYGIMLFFKHVHAREAYLIITSKKSQIGFILLR